MGYRAIKTSESGDKFLSTLFKFRTAARSCTRSQKEFCPGLGFRFWATSRRRLKLSPPFFWHVPALFEIILAAFCDARWHYLTLSWHYPPGRLWISLCLTPSQKTWNFKWKQKYKTTFQKWICWPYCCPLKSHCICILNLESSLHVFL